ncbi:MAG: pitrilysin family protein [Thermoanaerobaculia bacterium]|nr:pitrilysin family protein [Thermoanaerobaculia bacterium]
MTPAVDRSHPPAPGPLTAFRFPPFRHLRPAPGVDLYLARLGPTPLVHLELLTVAGGHYDPPGGSGLAALTAELTDEGTSSRTSMEIAAAAESLGGYLHSSAGWDHASISTSLPADRIDDAVELMLEVAADPTFPPDELERLRRRALTELRNRRSQPGSRAQRALARGLYGDTPYGGFLLGSEESVRAIERSQVVDFHRRYAAGGPVRVVAVGDLDPDRLADRLAERLPARPAQEMPELPRIEPVPRDAVEVHLVDRPTAAQTELRVGLPGLSRADPDSTRASLLNAILGGKFTSRINLNLRERHGYTYGAHSGFSRRLVAGPFVVRTAVANPVAAAATREILGELDRIRREPVTQEELEDARQYLLGVFPYTVQTIEGVAGRLGDLAVYGLPDDEYERLPRRLSTLTAEDLLEVARRYLDPERALVVAVGPGDELEDSLAELGPVRRVEERSDFPL